ncbi:SDR family oxidoreductase [Jatrophihabitans telluris]|uniref:SDR family oxidoreductase n=1 Tax=Jatrophihabitans telluris TaxID=2038343 RepID=A0ABY4R2E3_9ACTN|nr:SDR family oxidoreductase [Jatrophihabitans telluris]UQX89990.1 SDR family oxidoreductase [Jatrophihabitans telluris]
MQLKDAVVVITGAGSGIGAGLGRRFAAEGARAVVLADRDLAAARTVAAELGGIGQAAQVDVTDEAAVSALVTAVLAQHGRIDLFCSNAGLTTGVGLEAGAAADAAWQRAWEVHVLAHVYAARAVVPAMVEAGGGYLLNTASAAGLLTAPGDAPYSVTKHAAVAFAEWLAVEYADRNVRVSVLCPMGVATPLLLDPLAAGSAAARTVADSGPILDVETVAEAVVAAVTSEAFLVLPHPEVGSFWAGKAADVDRWLAGTARLYERSRHAH